jgi:predicted phosphodiesterase
MGNHDVELAVPQVMRHLIDTIADSDEARGRIVVSTQGHGFTARVAGKRIVCVHGNEADTWNVVDFDHLRRLIFNRQVGGTSEPWVPNAGSMLVIDVMNDIKRRFPFVDLLKPEKEAVVPLLWALDQGTGKRLARCMKIAGRLSWDTARRSVGLLSADPAPRQSESDGSSELFHILQATPSQTGSPADEVINRAMLQLQAGTDPLRLIDGTGDLGIAGAIWSKISNQSPDQVAFRALERVGGDLSFRRAVSDDTFEKIDAMIGDADFVIAGHTHLERDLERKRSAGRYFNTGTWARLIRVKPDWLSSIERFRPVWDALRNNTLDQLDTVKIDGHPIVTKRPTVAALWQKDGSIRAELQRIRLVDGLAVPTLPSAAEE